jgi:hypothetical protein
MPLPHSLHSLVQLFRQRREWDQGPEPDNEQRYEAEAGKIIFDDEKDWIKDKPPEVVEQEAAEEVENMMDDVFGGGARSKGTAHRFAGDDKRGIITGTNPSVDIPGVVRSPPGHSKDELIKEDVTGVIVFFCCKRDGDELSSRSVSSDPDIEAAKESEIKQRVNDMHELEDFIDYTDGGETPADRARRGGVSVPIDESSNLEFRKLQVTLRLLYTHFTLLEGDLREDSGGHNEATSKATHHAKPGVPLDQYLGGKGPKGPPRSALRHRPYKVRIFHDGTLTPNRQRLLYRCHPANIYIHNIRRELETLPPNIHFFPHVKNRYDMNGEILNTRKTREEREGALQVPEYLKVGEHTLTMRQRSVIRWWTTGLYEHPVLQVCTIHRVSTAPYRECPPWLVKPYFTTTIPLCHFLPLLQGVDYVWRMEPGSFIVQRVGYDIFAAMKRRDLLYAHAAIRGEADNNMAGMTEFFANFLEREQKKERKEGTKKGTTRRDRRVGDAFDEAGLEEFQRWWVDHVRLAAQESTKRIHRTVDPSLPKPYMDTARELLPSQARHGLQAILQGKSLLPEHVYRDPDHDILTNGTGLATPMPATWGGGGGQRRAKRAGEGLPYVHYCYYPQFEISSTKVWRSDKYREFVKALDEDGGIYTDGWGDACLRTLALMAIVPGDQVGFIGREAGKGFTVHHATSMLNPINKDPAYVKKMWEKSKSKSKSKYLAKVEAGMKSKHHKEFMRGAKTTRGRLVRGMAQHSGVELEGMGLWHQWLVTGLEKLSHNPTQVPEFMQDIDQTIDFVNKMPHIPEHWDPHGQEYPDLGDDDYTDEEEYEDWAEEEEGGEGNGEEGGKEDDAAVDTGIGPRGAAAVVMGEDAASTIVTNVDVAAGARKKRKKPPPPSTPPPRKKPPPPNTPPPQALVGVTGDEGKGEEVEVEEEEEEEGGEDEEDEDEEEEEGEEEEEEEDSTEVNAAKQVAEALLAAAFEEYENLEVEPAPITPEILKHEELVVVTKPILPVTLVPKQSLYASPFLSELGSAIGDMQEIIWRRPRAKLREGKEEEQPEREQQVAEKGVDEGQEVDEGMKGSRLSSKLSEPLDRDTSTDEEVVDMARDTLLKLRSITTFHTDKLDGTVGNAIGGLALDAFVVAQQLVAIVKLEQEITASVAGTLARLAETRKTNIRMPERGRPVGLQWLLRLRRELGWRLAEAGTAGAAAVEEGHGDWRKDETDAERTKPMSLLAVATRRRKWKKREQLLFKVQESAREVQTRAWDLWLGLQMDDVHLGDELDLVEEEENAKDGECDEDGECDGGGVDWGIQQLLNDDSAWSAPAAAAAVKRRKKEEEGVDGAEKVDTYNFGQVFDLDGLKDEPEKNANRHNIDDRKYNRALARVAGATKDPKEQLLREGTRTLDNLMRLQVHTHAHTPPTYTHHLRAHTTTYTHHPRTHTTHVLVHPPHSRHLEQLYAHTHSTPPHPPTCTHHLLVAGGRLGWLHSAVRPDAPARKGAHPPCSGAGTANCRCGSEGRGCFPQHAT